MENLSVFIVINANNSLHSLQSLCRRTSPTKKRCWCSRSRPSRSRSRTMTIWSAQILPLSIVLTLRMPLTVRLISVPFQAKLSNQICHQSSVFGWFIPESWQMSIDFACPNSYLYDVCSDLKTTDRGLPSFLLFIPRLSRLWGRLGWQRGKWSECWAEARRKDG